MSKFSSFRSIILGSLLFFLIIPLDAGAYHVSSSEPLIERVAGHILLQTEAHGEAWYVDPVGGGRYYLKDGPTAYAMMRHFGLGINEEDFQRLSLRDEELFDRLEGRIVIRVGYHGEAWYVHPAGARSIYYLQDGPAAYEMMRYLSMGITNADLSQIGEKTLTEPVLAEYSVEGEDHGIDYIPSGSIASRPNGWECCQTENIPVPVSLTVTTTIGSETFTAVGTNGDYNRSRAGLDPQLGTEGAVPFSLSDGSPLRIAIDVNNTDPEPGFYCYGFGNEFWYTELDAVNQTIELDYADEFQHYFDVHFAGQEDAKKSFQFRVHCANEYGTHFQDWVDIVVER